MKRVLGILAVILMVCGVRGARALPVDGRALAPRTPNSPVIILAHDPGYCTSLAKHLQRWLGQQQITADVVSPAEMSAALSPAKVAFLVGFNEPTKAELDALRHYRSRGGKLVVFYSASAQLAALMGVKPLGYATVPYLGAWSAMKFGAGVPTGVPAEIRQTSTVMQRAVPVPGKGRLLATWCDRTGKSTGEAAWISSAGGYWMTHVLLPDGDEDLKAQLVAALVGSLAPQLWNYDTFRARAAAEHKALRAYALRQVPRKGEIHAVWDHTGCGLYPDDWPRTMHVLQEARVTDLFVNVAGAGFAHYPSNVLPRSKTYEQEGDQLAACLAAAQAVGIRVHAWILCFNATRGSAAAKADVKKKGWFVKMTDGKTSEDYLDPANPDVRECLMKAIDEIQAKYAVSGIHLDFVRWYEKAKKPANAAEVVTAFVQEARGHVKPPHIFSTAVLGKYPACVVNVGQDWDLWLTRNLVDYVVPMDYSENPQKFESFLRQHAQNAAHARKTIVGIGVTANESRLSARQVIDQVNCARKYGFPGVALFDLDATLEKNILPYLKLGQW